MYYLDFHGDEPKLQHLAKRERPRDIASLYVHTTEWAEFRRICDAHGATEIVAVRKVPLIPAHVIDVLCAGSEMVLALMVAWGDYCETSPHRPHSKEEALAWGERHKPGVDTPPDLQF